MNIWINHYKATAEVNVEQYFDLEDYEDSASVDLYRNYRNFISDREFYSWEKILIGAPNLDLTQKLHRIKVIDLSKGINVIIVQNKEEFSNICTNQIIDKIDFRYSKMSIYELDYEGQIVYVLEVYRQMHTKSIYVELINRINTDIPKSYLNIFKEYFLYCKKIDLVKMHSKLKEGYKDEFYDKTISEFVPETSIIQIEY
jgi:hypothetical protein